MGQSARSTRRMKRPKSRLETWRLRLHEVLSGVPGYRSLSFSPGAAPTTVVDPLLAEPPVHRKPAEVIHDFGRPSFRTLRAHDSAQRPHSIENPQVLARRLEPR